MQRRQFLLTTMIAGAASAFGLSFSGRATGAEGHFPVSYTPDDWRRKLTSEQFAVLREEATERPYSSQLNANKASGLYHCVGCEAPLYSSETKFDSGTGWPSFFDVLEGSVGTTTDYKLVYPRTEVHCATCGGHLGHIFDDGPQPTGKRHCINGVVLAFRPGEVAS